MKRIVLIAGIAVLLVSATTRAVRAQPMAVGSPLAPDQTLVEGAGVKVGEGTVLHPVVGSETGYVSNVFYTNTDPRGAGLLRLLAELNFASLSGQRMESTDPSVEPTQEGDLEWHAGVRVIGEEYLSGSEQVGAQHNIAGGLNAHAIVFPHQSWRFGADEDYIRDTRPTNYESFGNLNRDINNLALSLQYAPLGRALSGKFTYSNRIDIFEAASHDFANRIQHGFALRVAWQWLPITSVFGDISFGVYSGLGSSSTKVSSFPFRVAAGIQSAITVDTAVNAQIGYANGFYSTGESFNTVTGRLTFAWRYLPEGQLFAAYMYDFTDSVQANFYRDHVFQVGINHKLSDRLIMLASVDARLRHYASVLPSIMGPPDRDDELFGLAVSPRYYFRDWLAATLDLSALVDSTDYRYTLAGQMVDPSYTRFQLMAGVRAAW
jgi:hypothetical protein